MELKLMSRVALLPGVMVGVFAPIFSSVTSSAVVRV